MVILVNWETVISLSLVLSMSDVKFGSVLVLAAAWEENTHISLAVINTSCCRYVDHSRSMSTDLNKIWQQNKILHELQKDDTSLGFAEV